MRRKEKRYSQFIQALKKQPYTVTLNNITLKVCKDVFPPDMGYTSKYLAKTLSRYHPESALDIGCGTGYLALVLKKNGAVKVWALDNHEPAVRCAKLNAKRNKMSIITVQSDLFQNVPGTKFDLIVFNQPYYPAKHPIFGLGSDGGKNIIKRFLKQAKHHLSSKGIIIMPFSDMAGKEHNPSRIAKYIGYKARKIFEHVNRGGRHFIYEISLS